LLHYYFFCIIQMVEQRPMKQAIVYIGLCLDH